MIGIDAVPFRLRELGDGPELIAWLRELGFEPDLVLFAARCAVGGAVARSPVTDPAGDRATAAFLAGFVSGICVHEAPAPETDTADVLVRAVRAVAAWGRHALIAQHCDLGAVASVENAFAVELSSGLDGGEELRRLLVRLYESGLATGLAAFQH